MDEMDQNFLGNVFQMCTLITLLILTSGFLKQKRLTAQAKKGRLLSCLETSEKKNDFVN